MRKKSVPKRSPLTNTLPDSPPAKVKRRNVEGIDNLFDSYANSASGLIEPEGIEALCLDIGLEHTDVRTLILAWKMEAQKQGYFSRGRRAYGKKISHDEQLFLKDEWGRGLRALQVDSLDKLQEAVSQLDVETTENFEDFYSYVYNFNRTDIMQRIVDVDSICTLLDVVLKPRVPLPVNFFIDSFIQYLKTQNEYKAISRDQWISFHRFFNEINFPGLKNYDANDAWPVILDEFVEWWFKTKKK